MCSEGPETMTRSTKKKTRKRGQERKRKSREKRTRSRYHREVLRNRTVKGKRDIKVENDSSK